MVWTQLSKITARKILDNFRLGIHGRTAWTLASHSFKTYMRLIYAHPYAS
jgi:hypothetical protein